MVRAGRTSLLAEIRRACPCHGTKVRPTPSGGSPFRYIAESSRVPCSVTLSDIETNDGGADRQLRTNYFSKSSGAHSTFASQLAEGLHSECQIQKRDANVGIGPLDPGRGAVADQPIEMGAGVGGFSAGIGEG